MAKMVLGKAQKSVILLKMVQLALGKGEKIGEINKNGINGDRESGKIDINKNGTNGVRKSGKISVILLKMAKIAGGKAEKSVIVLKMLQVAV
jgi:hypothetical protein